MAVITLFYAELLQVKFTLPQKLWNARVPATVFAVKNTESYSIRRAITPIYYLDK